MNIDLNKKFIGLNGDESLDDTTLGQLLAQMFASKEGKLTALKVMPWAFKLFKNESIEIDKADSKSICEFIETLKDITPLAKFQLLEEIQKQITE